MKLYARFMMRNILIMCLVVFVSTNTLKADSPFVGFIENKGQMVDQNGIANTDVLFQYVGKGFKIQLRQNGYSYELNEARNIPQIKPGKKTIDTPQDWLKALLITHRVDIDFKNSLKQINVIADEPNQALLNYVWNGKETYGVKSFKRVVYKNVYNKIDIEFLIQNNNEFKYNIILHPGAKIENVKFEIKGAQKAIVNTDGDLVISTSIGDVKENIPFSFYTNQPQINHAVSFHLNENTLGFSANYDQKKTLVIDPSSNLIWGNYIGGPALDYQTSVCIDAADNVYVGGYTFSSSNIATSAVYQTTLSGSFDSYLVKTDASGNMLWGTYFGGTSVDVVYSLGVDAAGNIYAGGDTFSTSNIASSGAHQPIYGGGVDDCMLFKFSPAGQRLWSTYYGGLEHDIIGSLTIDNNGDVIITGHTDSNNAIATLGAYSTVYGTGYDVFVTKFNSTGALQWGTYYGDTGIDEGWGIDCDETDFIYVTGFTSSLFGISSGTPHQGTYGGGFNDAFIAKFNPSGTNLVWGTYFGDNGDDAATSLKYDQMGKIIITGNTNSTVNIASAASHQSVLASAEDGYLTAFNLNGVQQWGTYFGGEEADYVNHLFIDSDHQLLFCGQTASSGSISTNGAFQPSISAQYIYDAFFAKFNNSGTQLLGSYFGGPESETSKGIVVDSQGKVYLAGESTSSVNIASAASTYSVYSGDQDAFLAKFCINSIIPLTPVTNATICLNDTIIISAPVGCISYSWNTSANTHSILVSNTITVGSFTYSVKVIDADGCDAASDTIQVDIEECTTSLDEQFGMDAAAVFPNPTASKITINLGNASNQTGLKLFSSMGQLLMEAHVYNKEVVLDLNEFGSGIYFLMIKQDETTITKKIIKH